MCGSSGVRTTGPVLDPRTNTNRNGVVGGQAEQGQGVRNPDPKAPSVCQEQSALGGIVPLLQDKIVKSQDTQGRVTGVN